jgi:hypothetical protein
MVLTDVGVLEQDEFRNQPSKMRRGTDFTIQKLLDSRILSGYPFVVR